MESSNAAWMPGSYVEATSRYFPGTRDIWGVTTPETVSEYGPDVATCRPRFRSASATNMVTFNAMAEEGLVNCRRTLEWWSVIGHREVRAKRIHTSCSWLIVRLFHKRGLQHSVQKSDHLQQLTCPCSQISKKCLWSSEGVTYHAPRRFLQNIPAPSIGTCSTSIRVELSMKNKNGPR